MKPTRFAPSALGLAVLVSFFPGCGSDEGSESGPPAATGGTAGSAGSSGKAGGGASQGGKAAGGASAGGSVGTGGTVSAGGNATGGKASAGGGGTSTGGKSGGGGTAAGGADGDAGDGGEALSGGSDGGAGKGSAGGPGAGGSGEGGNGGNGAGGDQGSGGDSGALDVFGIQKLYPSANPEAEWTSQHWTGKSYQIDGRIDDNDPSELSGMRGTGTLEVTDGQLVMSGTQPRIYIYPEDGAPWQNQEVTVYYQRVEDEGQAYAGLVVGVRSGEDGHTEDNACDAHTYYARVRNDGAFDFEKELEHPASSTQSRVQPDDAWPDGEVPRETWIGWKFVIYNQGSNVKLEAYRDMTNGVNGGDWELVNETVDDGGWSVETTCGTADDLIVVDGGVTFIRNTDVTEARYRWVSVREIAAP